MSQHFPEVIGLTFAATILVIFLFASGEGVPALLLGGAGVLGLAGAMRSRRRA